MSVAFDFVAPPPGLAPHTAFRLDAIDEADGLFALRAVADESVRLFVVDPAQVVPDYAPTLSDAQAGDLGLTDPAGAMLLVVARWDESGVGVNLLAPIVANRRTGAAAQVILEGQDLPMRRMLG